MEYHSVQLLKKCLDGLTCEMFNDYFTLNSYSKSTRNNDFLLAIPKVRLELSRPGFFSMGVKNFNPLPIEIRKAETFSNFVKLYKIHYS